MNREQLEISESMNNRLDNAFSPVGKKIFVALLFLAAIGGGLYAYSSKPIGQLTIAPQAIMQNNNIPETIMEVKPITQEKEIEINVTPKSSGKMVSLQVENVGRPNPFLPTSESYSKLKNYGLELMAPPETIASDTEAVKVVSTKVSGIMYEPKNPSAILNIEGEDYLVRSGDYINNYKVLSIEKDIVTVQLGVNVHKARVGEIISDATVNHNTVYDLENKFGGAKK